MAAELPSQWAELAAHRGCCGGSVRTNGANLQTLTAPQQETLESRQGREGRAGLVAGERRLRGAGPLSQLGLRKARVHVGFEDQRGDVAHGRGISI